MVDARTNESDTRRHAWGYFEHYPSTLSNLGLVFVTAPLERRAAFSQTTSWVDTASVSNNVFAFASASQESRAQGFAGFKRSQDRCGVMMLPDESILLVVADGVGQSFFGEESARAVVEAIRFNPTPTSLIGRIGDAMSILQQTQAALEGKIYEITRGLPPLLVASLTQTLKDAGSQTMLNLISINPQSRTVDGLIHGDGGISIIRHSGTVEYYPLSWGKRRLSTRHGLGDEPERLNRVIDPSKLGLQPQDALLVYSDGLQRRVSGKSHTLVDEICTTINQFRQNPDSLVYHIQSLMAEETENDDDKSLLIFIQP